MAEHGTNAGYLAHRRARPPEDACDACREAARIYQAENRAANPARVARDAARNAARGRALRRLAARHPREFQELFEKEKRRFGHEGS